MKKQIVQVSMLQSAKVVAGLYFVISLPVALVMLAFILFSGQGGLNWLFVIVPFIQVAFGFVFALFGGWLYNLVASRIGGFEFMTAEVGSTTQH